MIDVGNKIREHSLPVTKFHIHSGSKPLFSFDFSLIHSDQNINNIFSFPQYQLEELLERKYLSLGGEITYGAELISIRQDETSVISDILVDDKQITATSSFLVGCDGAHSTTRSFTSCKMEGHSYDNTFIVADGILQPDHKDMYIDFDAGHTFISREGYTMLFPLPGGRHRVVIDGNPDSPPLDLDALHSALTDRGFSHLKFQTLDWLSNAVLNAKVADKYNFKRIALAGDACHLHSPVGGQGINLGVQDSFNLAWKLSQVLQHNMHPDVISSYSDERRIVAKKVIANTDKLHNMLVSRSPLTSLARNSFLPLLSKAPSIQRSIAADLSGITTSYRSLYLTDKSSSNISKGDRIPNVTLHQEGCTTTLYDLINKPQHSLILVSQSGSFENIKTSRPEDIIMISTTPCASPKENVYHTHDPTFTSILSRKSGSAFLVARPDGHLHHIEPITSDRTIENAINLAMLDNT